MGFVFVFYFGSLDILEYHNIHISHVLLPWNYLYNTMVHQDHYLDGAFKFILKCTLIGWELVSSDWSKEKSFWKPDWISTVVWIESFFWIMPDSIWKISVPTLTRDTPNLLRNGPRIWTVRTPTTVTCPCHGQKKGKFHFSFIWKMKNTKST